VQIKAGAVRLGTDAASQALALAAAVQARLAAIETNLANTTTLLNASAGGLVPAGILMFVANGSNVTSTKAFASA
jgi:hypothetical protein